VWVEIKAPEGLDAKVCQEITKPHWVYFLQSALVKKDHPEVVPKAVELLRAFPKSGYHDAMKWALQEYYGERIRGIGQLTAQQDPELEKIREALGIPKVAEGPFPEDQRLDQLIAYHCPKETPLEQVFRVVSAQSGVPLSLAPELTVRSVTSLPITATLRRFMRDSAEYKATWIRHGDGYRLVPAPQPK
jgi:hypothetical protein